MTVAFFSGKARRAGVALGAVSAGLLVLSACDKPTPMATMTVGTDTVHSEATCYNDGKPLAQSDIQACVNKKATHTIKAGLDDTIRIGVDPEIADHGWTVFVDGKPSDPELSKRTYRTQTGTTLFAPDPSTGQPAPTTRKLSVLQIDGKNLTGVWNFTLEKSS